MASSSSTLIIGTTSAEVKSTNQTMTEYIHLQLAADMLRDKAGTVSEVAYKVGFESLLYFSKVFIERFGILPSEYT